MSIPIAGFKIDMIFMWRLDDIMYIFGYYGWGLCIVHGTGHRQWSGVA